MRSDAACNLPLLLTRWAIEHRSACGRRYSTLVTAVYTLKLAFYILPQTTKIYDITHSGDLSGCTSVSIASPRNTFVSCGLTVQE